jgi:hypothetical protein
VFRYAGITGILKERCRHMYRYAGLTYLICCAGAGESGLPYLHRSLVRHICSGYGQRPYPGYRSQPRCRIPTIKEENIQAWKQSMMTGCTVEVYQPSLCTSTALTSQLYGHSPRSTWYSVAESHREQLGAKSRVSAFVSWPCLECSWCLLVSCDRCNPGHHYIRWHREP